MSYETKDMTGSLFQNRKKEKDTHPDMTGTIVVNGTEYRIAGWGKKSDKAGKWLSLAISEIQEREEKSSKTSEKPPSKFDDLEDDIPF